MSDVLFWLCVGLGFGGLFAVLGLLSWWGAASWDRAIHQYGWCSNPGCGSKRHS